MKNRADLRAAKLHRIRAGAPPRVLELCAGCGGLSLGLAAAGFELSAHVELDPTAAATFALNFAPPPSVNVEAWCQARDMERNSAADLVGELGLKEQASGAFDVIAAGLPCQAFARIGRSKLRSIRGIEDAYRTDPRAKLYKKFLEYVEAIQPIAILVENVPDILNFGGINVPEEICDTLEAAGYTAAYTLLNSAHFGVPQMRERLFLSAVDSSLGSRLGFPPPTHQVKLPSGYDTARSVALKHVPEHGRYVQTESPAKGLPAITCKAALSDLPFISEHVRDPEHMRRRKVSDALPYRTFADLTPYQRSMREWPGFHAGGVVTGNVVRITPRDFPVFAAMPRGAEYPTALKVAERLFHSYLQSEMPHVWEGSREWQELRKLFVPPYDPGKFANKWWKLDPGLPSRTLTAHMGKDTYSHIHWDSRQQRTISVREAARLQSFPDGFRFSGAMNAAFKQIGNAVPPILAQAVGKALLAGLVDKEVRTGVAAGAVRDMSQKSLHI